MLHRGESGRGERDALNVSALNVEDGVLSLSIREGLTVREISINGMFMLSPGARQGCTVHEDGPSILRIESRARS